MMDDDELNDFIISHAMLSLQREFKVYPNANPVEASLFPSYFEINYAGCCVSVYKSNKPSGNITCTCFFAWSTPLRLSSCKGI